MINTQKDGKFTDEQKKLYMDIALDYASSQMSSSEIACSYGYGYTTSTIINKACHVAIELLLVDDLVAEKIYDRAYRSTSRYRKRVEDKYIRSFEIRNINKKELEMVNAEIKKITKKRDLYKAFLNTPNMSSKNTLEKMIEQLENQILELEKQIA